MIKLHTEQPTSCTVSNCMTLPFGYKFNIWLADVISLLVSWNKFHIMGWVKSQGMKK